MNTNSTVLRDTSSAYSKVSQNQIQWGDPAIANANDSIAWANGETPVAQFVAQGGTAPEAFPADTVQGLLSQYGIPTFNGPTLFPQAAPGPTGAPATAAGSTASYDCATGTCSDGQPPNPNSSLMSYEMRCKYLPKSMVDSQACGRGILPDYAPNLNPLSNASGDLFGLDTKSIFLILAGIAILVVGLFVITSPAISSAVKAAV